MPIILHAIERNGSIAEAPSLPEGVAQETASSYPAYYEAIGFAEPWIGYLARRDGEWAGACGFKGAPKDGHVEIAYFTFPEFEGQGIATEMANALLAIAAKAEPPVTVTARTLPQEGASTAILRKLGFARSGAATDADDGNVWEWVLERQAR